MSWDPPKFYSEGDNERQEYVISWSLNDEERENIFVSGIQSFSFGNLRAGQKLTASVRFFSKYGKLGGPPSEIKQILLPGGR